MLYRKRPVYDRTFHALAIAAPSCHQIFSGQQEFDRWFLLCFPIHETEPMRCQPERTHPVTLPQLGAAPIALEFTSTRLRSPEPLESPIYPARRVVCVVQVDYEAVECLPRPVFDFVVLGRYPRGRKFVGSRTQLVLSSNMFGAGNCSRHLVIYLASSCRWIRRCGAPSGGVTHALVCCFGRDLKTRSENDATGAVVQCWIKLSSCSGTTKL